MFRPEGAWPYRIGEGVGANRGLLVTADEVGYFSQNLTRGPYYLWIEDSDRGLIYVPSTPDYILLADLLAPGEETTPEEGDGGQNWRLSNAQRQLLNATNGAWHTPFVGELDNIEFEADGPGGETPNFRYRGGMLELYKESDDTWHAPFMNNGSFAMAAGGETPFVNDRMLGGVWQIKDVETGTYRTWFIVGETGEEALAFGSEVA